MQQAGASGVWIDHHRISCGCSLATASDWQHEGSHGETFVSLNALLMRLYIAKYHVHVSVLLPFFAVITVADAAGRLWRV